MRLVFSFTLISLLMFGGTSNSNGATPDRDLQELQGRADQVSFESWLGRLSLDQRRGANHWIDERSRPKPVSCTTSSINSDYLSGCQEAQRRLTAFDVRRKSEPDYNKGWNAPIQATTGSVFPATSQAKSSDPQPALGGWVRVQQARNEIYAMQQRFDQLLDVYAHDTECAGKSYDDVAEQMYNLLDRFDTYPSRQESIRDFAIQATDLVNLGDIAAKKKCYEEARTNYLQTIRIFTGDPYAAMRQRAQIGMEEIRGK